MGTHGEPVFPERLQLVRGDDSGGGGWFGSGKVPFSDAYNDGMHVM